MLQERSGTVNDKLCLHHYMILASYKVILWLISEEYIFACSVAGGKMIDGLVRLAFQAAKILLYFSFPGPGLGMHVPEALSRKDGPAGTPAPTKKIAAGFPAYSTGLHAYLYLGNIRESRFCATCSLVEVVKDVRERSTEPLRITNICFRRILQMEHRNPRKARRGFLVWWPLAGAPPCPAKAGLQW
jgi:hypothetical protein